jgi:hypothetical protein
MSKDADYFKNSAISSPLKRPVLYYSRQQYTYQACKMTTVTVTHIVHKAVLWKEKEKVKFALEETMKAQRRSKGVALLFL